MNEYDSDYLSQCLKENDFLPSETPEEADLIVVNTCTVREKAAQKAFSLLGRTFLIKQQKPSLIIGMTGCIAQQEGDRLLKRFPKLNFVLGTREIGRINEIIEQIDGRGTRDSATRIDIPPPPFLGQTGYFQGRVKSHLSIMEGCNNYCSYCIVPYVRGRENSRSPEELRKEAEALVQDGVKDITLLGQNVNSYRWVGDNKKNITFPELLRQINDIEGLLRLRFTTSHPKDLSSELIHSFKELDKLCPHIHLPVQSGSNTILKAMNRHYTREHFFELVRQLKGVTPHMAITSDIIVGFPGETDHDFELTIDLLEKIEFDNLFSFVYSDRKGTTAEKMKRKLSEREKKARLAILQEYQRKITLRKNKALEGKMVSVLVEGTSKKGNQLTGRTGSNKVVNFANDIRRIGCLVDVKIESAHFNSLRGTAVFGP
jgi:tRNA-2-methylthio-N6-dimethylallyladenosine synthase